MKKLILLFLVFLISCQNVKENQNVTEKKQQIIAYYAGDEKSIDEFDLTGVDQLIYSFLHLKGNKLAIDNETDSLTLINVVNHKK